MSRSHRNCLFVALGLQVLVASSLIAAETKYDLLLKGGHLIDPANQKDELCDVAILDEKISLVQPNIPAVDATRVVRIDGLYVVPGLVDAHVHVFAGTGKHDVYAGDRSVYPDGHAFRSGVTTVVDAGTSGWRTFADFKHHIIDNSDTRVLAWLNIVGVGMVDRESQQNPHDMLVEPAAEIVRRFSDSIIGIKTAHYDGPEWIAVDQAIKLGDRTSRPVMVDFGAFLKERPFQQLVLEKMRPGDTYTHMFYRPVPILDRQGKLLPYLHEARKRGVRFDLGHGRDSFLWSQAVPAVRQGWIPDTISTDLHVGNMNAGMKDMTTCMSKFLNLGIPMGDVVRMSTSNPAKLIGRKDLGTLRQGVEADVAVLRLRKGEFGFVDAHNFRLKGKYKLECELTLRAGRVVWDLNGISGQDLNDVDIFSQTEPSR